MARGAAGRRTDHGWWPYVLPYAAFLVTIQILSRVPPDSVPGLGLLLKPAVPAALMLYFFFARGAYPELRRPRADLAGRLLDVAVGLALAALWMAPYVWIDALRPADAGFDPSQLGASHQRLALALRLFGYALVTPFFEELFIRSFVMRYAEVWAERGDFRRVPLAHYSARSFLATVVVFTLGHLPWEWWVAVPWVALTNLWFYWRRDLYAVIVAHATTNAAILAAAVLWSGYFHDGAGRPIALWFLV